MQLVGVKYVRLYDRAQTPYLYRKPAAGQRPRDATTRTGTAQRTRASPDSQGNSSAVGRHVEEPGALERWPMLRKAQYSEVLLRPGDALYIPSGMWHYVRALTGHPSLSTNFWF